MAARIALDSRDVRTASAVLLGTAVLVPLVPGHGELACPLRTMTGVPCPLCGLTTSVTETVRLDVADAVVATPAGIVAVLGAVAVLALRPRRLSLSVLAVPLALLAMWAWQLHRSSIL